MTLSEFIFHCHKRHAALLDKECDVLLQERLDKDQAKRQGHRR